MRLTDGNLQWAYYYISYSNTVPETSQTHTFLYFFIQVWDEDITYM